MAGRGGARLQERGRRVFGTAIDDGRDGARAVRGLGGLAMVPTAGQSVAGHIQGPWRSGVW